MRVAFFAVTMAMVFLFVPNALAQGTRNETAKAVVSEALEAKDLAVAMKTGRTKGDVKRHLDYARYFIKYGSKWGVDPLLLAAVGYTESGFRAKPLNRYGSRCGMVNTRRCGPGPCPPRWERVCKRYRITAGEVGLMQVLWYDKSTRVGYKLCTGKDLLTKRQWQRLKRDKKESIIAKIFIRRPDIAICVGAYELSKWKQWAYKGGNGSIACWRYKRWRRNKPLSGWKWCPLRMTPRREHNVRFFKRYPELRRHFWVSFHNWGSNKWAGNWYPSAVLRTYKRLLHVTTKLRVARQIRKNQNKRVGSASIGVTLLTK